MRTHRTTTTTLLALLAAPPARRASPWRARSTRRLAGAAAGGAAGCRAGPRPKAQVHKSGIATWFGPGFYGQKTACGQTLTPGVVGVANRTLPCGTLVKVSYKGHALTVPVLDRGPYSHIGADWDLTAGAAAGAGHHRNRPHRHARRRQRAQHAHARRAARHRPRKPRPAAPRPQRAEGRLPAKGTLGPCATGPPRDDPERSYTTGRPAARAAYSAMSARAASTTA